MGVEISLWTSIQIGLACLFALIGCSVLWSIATDSAGGVPDNENGAHHAFNFNVASVFVALLINVGVTISTNKYIRVLHFFSLGLTAYLITGVGLGDVINANSGFKMDAKDACRITASPDNCAPVQPMSLAMINLARMKQGNDDVSEGDKKWFSGAFFCWLSLLMGLMAPLQYSVNDDKVVFKIIFWLGGLVMAGIGTIVLATQDVASPYGNQLYTTYRASMQIIALTLFIQLTSSMAIFATDHAVCKFTAAICGYSGWIIIPTMFTIVQIAKDQNAGTDDIAKIRTGGIFCWFSILAQTVGVAFVLGGDDHGGEYRAQTSTSVKV